MSHVKVKSYAKLNLFLEVLGRRSDGYHDIETLMVPVSLHDTVVVSTAPRFRVSFDPPVVPPEKNTIMKANELLASAVSGLPQFRVKIKKRIPIFAGMGGGSSNAAAFLRGALKIAGKSVPVSKLNRIAERVGSDVPFFLYGGPAVCTSKGEIVRRVEISLPPFFVIVDTSIGVSTPFAYQRVDEAGDYKRKSVVEFRKTLKPFNRFQEILFVLSRELEAVRQKLNKRTRVQFTMTGSGGAFFAPARSKSAAESLQKKCEKLGYRTFVVTPVRP